MKKIMLLLIAVFIIVSGFAVDFEKYEGKYIEKVILTHDKNLSNIDNDLTMILRVEEGTTFSIKNLNDDIKDLWDLGYFNNIKAEADWGKVGLIIKFVFEDKYTLKNVLFSGNDSFSDKKLLKKGEISDEKGNLPPYYDEYFALSGLKQLVKYYHKKGFLNVKINYSIEKLEDNKVNLKYEIKENNKFYISRIELEGNENFKTAKLIKILKIHKRTIINRGYFDEKNVDNGLNNLRAFYKDNGYISVKVLLKSTEKVDNHIKIVIGIEEGKPFNFGDVNISYAKDQIKPVIKVNKLNNAVINYTGKPYSENLLMEIIQKIRSGFTNIGYLSVVLNSKKIYDLKNNKINLIINIEQGEQFFVNSISIKPLNKEKMKTKDWVLLREMFIKEKDPFSVKLLQETQKRLFNLNYFENIYPIYTEIPGTNKLDIIWYAQEKPTGKAQIGGGYSNEEKFIGFVEIGEENFMGYGYKLNFKYEHSKYKDDFNLSFTDPWFLNPWVLKKQLAFSINVYKTSFDRYELFYKEYKNGISLRLGKNFWRYYQFSFEIKHDEIRLSVDDENKYAAPQDVLNNLGWNVTNSLSLALIRDHRDYFFNPQKGTKFSFNTTFAGNFLGVGNDKWIGLGGNAHYVKMVTQGEYYLPTFWKFILGMRMKFGYILGTSNQPVPPIYERFFIGGDYSVRGYEDRSIGYTELSYARENWKWEYANFSTISGRWVIINPNTGDWIDPYSGIIIDKTTGKEQYSSVNGGRYPSYGVSYYPTGGTKIFNFNMEYKFPIYQKLWGAFFYDAGNIWSDIYRDTNGDGVVEKVYSEPFSINNFKLAQSVGFGIRLEVPMLGVIRVDYGFGLSHPTNSEVGKNFSNTKLHFTIGNVF
ncbi:outer membrane protein assembly factor BamA [bacterium]|nr:outer membrane protein assembly factor BamA [bacterium]